MRTIPLIDIRSSGLIALAEQERARARELMTSSRGAFGLASRLGSYPALPLGDILARRWLTASDNPHRGEIEAFARIVGMPGVVALNLSYEWGCTTAAYGTPSGVTMTRVLDWPFPGLGETLVVAHQRGPAGEFYNVTWPAVSGVYTAMAPGRFAAALNQAPMRRYATGLVLDWVRNRVRLHREHALPPAHLLRHVCEEAPDYATAVRLLTETPVCLPVLYVLTGTAPGEGCVIERLERDAVVRALPAGGHGAAGEGRVAVANHFESRLNGIGHGWMPRPIDSHGRAVMACAKDAPSVDPTSAPAFDWLHFPVRNRFTRLAFVADAGANDGAGAFHLQGMEAGVPVTEVLRVGG